MLHGGRADVISIGFVLALWAGSSATATFVNTITIAYDSATCAGRCAAGCSRCGCSSARSCSACSCCRCWCSGPTELRKAVPKSARATVGDLIDFGYYPVLVVLLLLGLTTFYKLAPPRRLPWHRGLPGATLAGLVFLAGSAGLRAYITFILDHNHAYGNLAAPIAALLYFFVLALGVLLGAELNAAIEEHNPSKIRPPRVLDPRDWKMFRPDAETVEPPEAPPVNGATREPDAAAPRPKPPSRPQPDSTLS